MPYVAGIAVAVVALVLLAIFLARARAARPTSAPTVPDFPPTPVMPVKNTGPLTRTQLAERLQRLEEAPVPPPELSAMCYESAAPPTTAVYVCPKDGSRTHYSRDAALAERIEQLPILRAAVQTVSGLKVSLDESELCSRCTPTPPPSPEPILIVKLPDGAEKRTRAVIANDLLLLREFADGQLTHRGEDGAETPLKDFLPRIRQMLGMPGAEVGHAPKPGEDR